MSAPTGQGRRKCASRAAAFTLLEMAVVLMVLSLLAALGLRYATMRTDSDSGAVLNSTLDAIDAAILNYRITNGRLPCPADITATENSSSFGTEVGTPGDGNCTGYNFINSGTDPDGTGGSDPGAPDPLYDAATLNQVVAGSVPTKTLKLADKYAYDPWGRKILYVVDKRITATSAFTTYPVFNNAIGAIVIKRTATDTLTNAIATNAVQPNSGYKGAIYALVSHGPNGHGGYVRNVSTAAQRYSSGSTNTDELKNCHCNGSGVGSGTVIDRIFVQNMRSYNSGSLTGTFDDVVRFGLRQDVTSPNAESAVPGYR